MPWPDDFATCALVFDICFPNDSSAGCLGRIISLLLEKNGSESSAGCLGLVILHSWFSGVSLVLLFLFICLPHIGFSARCLGWMIMLPIWGLCLWICLPPRLLSLMPSLDDFARHVSIVMTLFHHIFFSLSVFLFYSYTFYMDWH